MPVYNKLVRDFIPRIIEERGKEPKTKILNKEEYHKELRNKLQEEISEYLEAGNDADAVEEQADALEVITALAGKHGVSMEQLEQVKKEKSDTRGAFNERVFLVQVEE
ncbi:nucleoside triphosphate pyrophosphohydrolase [Halobacillus litoralis]|uniref:nucleoside triphosphate pyrophosphohydrolase n=1 Tax=Halobacillus litoralis TaxID=45668 RepID=UPI001CFCA998|nr:nucleoside triphosphate pyrophosphohydrolase [Halobacillus litoralis]